MFQIHLFQSLIRPFAKGHKARWVCTSQLSVRPSVCLPKWTPGAIDALGPLGCYLFFWPIHTYLQMPPRISQSVSLPIGEHRRT